MSLRNVVRNFLSPSYAPAMLHKLKLRLTGGAKDPKGRAESTKWCQQVAQDVQPFARALAPELWEEAVRFGEELHRRAQSTLAELGQDLGGGGHYPLLYFLTRVRRPRCVVETGVGAGYSSQAVLRALSANGGGHLYSSDLPYFRVASPERFVGVLVEEELKPQWTLYVKGDRANLPEILSSVSTIDLFHYDSDKSYSGRDFAMSLVQTALSDTSVVMMDDIQDNLFFRDYAERRGHKYRVFGFEGKYIGLIGL